MPLPKLTNTIIEAAIVGFEAQKKKLEAQIAELRAMLTDSQGTATAAPAVGKGRRKFSAATLKRMGEAQKQRWAKAKGGSGAASKVAPAVSKPKPKRKLSAAGKKRIIEASKRYWAAKRAASAQSTPAKKAERE